MEGKYSQILDELKSKSVLTVGGTEAVSVAYSVAYAKKKAQGELKRIIITVDSSIFKTGLNVVIPGCEERGLDIAAALGFVCGNVEDKLQILSHYDEMDLLKAKQLLAQGRVNIQIKNDCDKLFIETIIESSDNVVRTLIIDYHLNVISEENVMCLSDLKEYQYQVNRNYIVNENMGPNDFVDFVNAVDSRDLEFIETGLKYNLELADYPGEDSMIRRFEEVIEEYAANGTIPGFVHLSIGQEACQAGVVDALKKTDYKFPDHRGHGAIALCGTDPKLVMAEIFAKETGINHGRGGSMHVNDLECRNMGFNGIQGSTMVTCLGTAFASVYNGTDDVTAVFLGDGTLGEGT